MVPVGRRVLSQIQDEVFCCETMKMLLVMLVMLEKLLQCPRNPTVTDTDGQAPLHQAAGDMQNQCCCLRRQRKMPKMLQVVHHCTVQPAMAMGDCAALLIHR